MFTPFPGIEEIAPSLRRQIAHCFGGMALCALMGYHHPMLCFGLTSAAVAWEPTQTLELANLVRVNLLLFATYRLGLVDIRAEEGYAYAADAPEQHDAFVGPNGAGLRRLPRVYFATTNQLVLPAVLKSGTAAMLEGEREVVSRKEWEEVGRHRVYSLLSLCFRHRL
jgi:hypothetical protein